jgi:hypothetical protein
MGVATGSVDARARTSDTASTPPPTPRPVARRCAAADVAIRVERSHVYTSTITCGGSIVPAASSHLGRRSVVTLAAIGALLAVPAPASAESDKSRFFEETAEAFWAVPHDCPDGSTVTATLLVRTTRDFEYPDTDDVDPTARVQYLAVCPDGSSFTWGGIVPATITSGENLKHVTASGSGTVRDIFSETHTVSFEVSWTAVGPIETTVNGPGSSRKQREAIASGVVTFDGAVLVDGQALHPTRPEPFIRTDLEK